MAAKLRQSYPVEVLIERIGVDGAVDRSHEMPNTSLTRWLHVLGLAALAALLVHGPGAQAQERQFKSQDCLSCHESSPRSMPPRSPCMRR